jgi:hypothetical protein
LIYPGQVITIPAASYNPPPYIPPVVTPVPAPAEFDGTLTVIAIEGVNIRDQPSYKGKILYRDDYTKGKTFYYKKSSVTKDDTYLRVWVEVVFAQSSGGYSIGWLPVSGPQDFLNHTGPIQDWVTPHIQ